MYQVEWDEINKPENLKTIDIRPTIYQSQQSYQQIIQTLMDNPIQKCNTPEAFQGTVMEFVLVEHPTGPVGSLDEFWEFDGGNHFKIHVEGKVIYVVRLTTGHFVIDNH